jgi:hypothetical protein
MRHPPAGVASTLSSTRSGSWRDDRVSCRPEPTSTGLPLSTVSATRACHQPSSAKRSISDHNHRNYHIRELT